jgi:hypothetical protein
LPGARTAATVSADPSSRTIASRSTRPPDAHHDRLRFSWSLAANGGAPVAVGTDYVTVSDDGRMHSVTGFLEPAE